jgi:hypothetical protein
MKKYAKVEIVNTGGEFTYGIIEDGAEVAGIKDLIDNGQEI